MLGCSETHGACTGRPSLNLKPLSVHNPKHCVQQKLVATWHVRQDQTRVTTQALSTAPQVWTTCVAARTLLPGHIAWSAVHTPCMTTAGQAGQADMTYLHRQQNWPQMASTANKIQQLQQPTKSRSNEQVKRTHITRQALAAR